MPLQLSLDIESDWVTSMRFVLVPGQRWLDGYIWYTTQHHQLQPHILTLIEGRVFQSFSLEVKFTQGSSSDVVGDVIAPKSKIE